MTLSPAERSLALRATVVVVAARLALMALGYARVKRSVDRTQARVRRGPEHAVAVRRAVARAARSVPGTRCLAQAVAATRLLRESGLPAELSIGVMRTDGATRGIDAHAWVRSAGFLVVGDADLSRYAELGGVHARS